MDRVIEIETQLNRMFQFLFKEDKKYIFIDIDKIGYININVADIEVFEFIVNDKQRFIALVDDYLDIQNVRIRKFKGNIPDLSERPQLLKEEVIITERIKEKVYIFRKINGNEEAKKELESMETKLFELRDNAWERNKKNSTENNKDKEDYHLFGVYNTLAELHPYIKKIKKLFK